MSFAEKLTTKEDVTKEASQIIENSFLDQILQIITSNERITKEQLADKILINSAAGTVSNPQPYMTTIYGLLEILNLSGKIPKEKFTELRGDPELSAKKVAHQNTRAPQPRKREKTKVDDVETALQSGLLGIVKTPNVEVKIRSVADLEFARLALDKLEKELSNSQSDDIANSPTPEP